MPDESQPAMRKSLEAMVPFLVGRHITDYLSLIQACWGFRPCHPSALAGLEGALLDAYARHQDLPLYRLFSRLGPGLEGRKPRVIETDLTLSVAPPVALFFHAKAAWKKGFRRLKIKLGKDSAEKNAQRLLAVHQAVPRAELLADGNQGMNLSEALRMSEILKDTAVPLLFLEQPFPKHDLISMRKFRRKSRIPLLADESVLAPADARRVLESGAADGVVIKLAKSGILGALEIIQITRRLKKKLAISCMEESKLGLAASVHLACATGVFSWVDLDSVFLLEPSREKGGFHIQGSRLSVAGIRSGIGIP